MHHVMKELVGLILQVQESTSIKHRIIVAVAATRPNQNLKV